MTDWETLETYLQPGMSFNCAGLAQSMNITNQGASAYIQAYLDAQRRVWSRTAYALRREGRTKAAVWYVGAKASDARGVMVQLVDDIATTFNDSAIPDLNRMADLNPRCQTLVSAIGASLIANINLLKASIP